METETKVRNMAKSKLSSHRFNGPDYDTYWEKWCICRDVFAGGDRVKSLGAKYLPKSAWHRNGGTQGEEDYKAFKQRAIFYNYLREAIQTMLGVLQKGKAKIELPKSLEFFKDSATPYKDGLEALAGRLAKQILLVGNGGLSLEVAGDGKSTAEMPDFYINTWQPESIKDKDFTSNSQTGETFARFVLLDETDEVFNYKTKQREPDEKWRVLALDENGLYYTAFMKPEEWEDFDIFKPVRALKPDKPQSGEAVYPLFRGKPCSRIPFTFVNSTDLSGGHYEDPPLYELVNLVLSLYRGEADYRQTLHFTASDFYKMTGCDGNKSEEELMVGAGGIVKLEGDRDIGVVSSSGGGARLQMESLDRLHELCQRKIVTLLDVGANQSGRSLEIIQGSKSALIEPMNQNIGKALEEQLRYAAVWSGMSREEAFANVKYIPAKIEDTSVEIAGLISLWISKKQNALPITAKDFHALLQKAGITDKEFEDYMDELEVEGAEEVASELKKGGYLPGEPRKGGEVNGKEKGK